jgi:hypothetical protein
MMSSQSKELWTFDHRSIDSSTGGLTMNSRSLEKWQIERLYRHAQQELHYLDRLEGRMHQKHFPADDAVYDRVKLARAAIKELSIQLHHLMGLG